MQNRGSGGSIHYLNEQLCLTNVQEDHGQKLNLPSIFLHFLSDIHHRDQNNPDLPGRVVGKYHQKTF